jgi:hypothetical protein
MGKKASARQRNSISMNRSNKMYVSATAQMFADDRGDKPVGLAQSGYAAYWRWPCGGGALATSDANAPFPPRAGVAEAYPDGKKS